MKKISFTLLVLCAAIFTNAQQPTPVADPVLMTVAGKPVYKSEFESIFKKNNREQTITQESLDEYMNLFINFKLKVAEAEKLGLDTTAKFKEELSGYRKQLARPYLIDTQLNDELIKEAYERLKEEIKASHILALCDENAAPKDTLEAYMRIQILREYIQGNNPSPKLLNDYFQLVKKNRPLAKDSATVAQKINSIKELPAKLKGTKNKDELFDLVAQYASEDRSAQKNKGNLGYFTSMQMVYPFENACYSMKAGETSKQPVRTRFGYHLVKVTDRRPARGQIKVAHILILSRENDTPEAKETAKKKADEIHKRALAGEKFEDLARTYSDDQSTARKGGELPMFGTGRMVEEFEEACFNLKTDGEISPLVKTAFGWHIIKRLEYKPLEPFDEIKGQLKQRIQKDVRAQLPQKTFVNKLKTKYNFKEDAKQLAVITKLIDTSIFNGEWKADKAAKLKNTMFEFAGNKYTIKDFAVYLENNQRKMAKEDIPSYTAKSYERWQEQIILDYEDSKLESTYPEFKNLLKEYRDGILLFEISDQKVWSKAIKDTVGLREYYNNHKNNYMWPLRIDADIYYCANAKIAKSLRKDLTAKKPISNDDLLKKYNKDNPLNLKIDAAIYNYENNEILKNNNINKVGISPDINHNNQVVIVQVKNVLQPTPKTITEARGIITSDYQNHLEKEWLEHLKRTYPVEINKEILYTIK